MWRCLIYKRQKRTVSTQFNNIKEDWQCMCNKTLQRVQVTFVPTWLSQQPPLHPKSSCLSRVNVSSNNKTHLGLHIKFAIFLYDFIQNFTASIKVSLKSQMSNFMEIRKVRAALTCAERRSWLAPFATMPKYLKSHDFFLKKKECFLKVIHCQWLTDLTTVIIQNESE